MKRLAAAAALATMMGATTMSHAQAVAAPTPAAAANAGVYSVEDTDVGTLLDDPASKAVLAKYLPAIVSSPQVDMARSMTLKSMQQYAPDQITDATLASIQADLNKLPKKK